MAVFWKESETIELPRKKSVVCHIAQFAVDFERPSIAYQKGNLQADILINCIVTD